MLVTDKRFLLYFLLVSKRRGYSSQARHIL
jgi:hypothetical protein